MDYKSILSKALEDFAVSDHHSRTKCILILIVFQIKYLPLRKEKFQRLFGHLLCFSEYLAQL